jgi:hypothetical protein
MAQSPLNEPKSPSKNAKGKSSGINTAQPISGDGHSTSHLAEHPGKTIPGTKPTPSKGRTDYPNLPATG